MVEIDRPILITSVVMITLRKSALAAFLVTGFIIPTILQHPENERMKVEAAGLRAQIAALAKAPVTEPTVSQAERARQQADRTELFRLRVQAALLRSELQKDLAHDRNPTLADPAHLTGAAPSEHHPRTATTFGVGDSAEER
jgi:hypothetical protein